jgi:thymidylate synthase (FAD)
MEVRIKKFPNHYDLLRTTVIGKTSYHSESYDEIERDIKASGREREIVIEFLKKIIELGHESVLEHITFTFNIQYISRWGTHELVRHRIGSFTQKSLRRKRRLTLNDFIINPILSDDVKENKKIRHVRAIMEYKKDIANGMSADDARAELPGSVASEISWTINLRSLRNFLSQRYTPKAYWEMRVLAKIIFDFFTFYKMEFLVEDLKVYEGVEIDEKD